MAIAEMNEDIAQTALEATRIRFEAGAATELDVVRAENDLAVAQREMRGVGREQLLAYTQLASLLGATSDALVLDEDLAVTGQVPELETVLAALEGSTELISARQSVELAEVQLAAVDNAFSPRAEIEAARNALTNAQTSLQETERDLRLRAEGSLNAARLAAGALESAEASLTTSQRELDAQLTRFEAGSISRIALEEAKRDHAQVEAQAEEARHAFFMALLALEHLVNVELGIMGG